jgi:hypothetical protein
MSGFVSGHYPRVPHICPVLADVGTKILNEPLLYQGTTSVVPNSPQILRASAPEFSSMQARSLRERLFLSWARTAGSGSVHKMCRLAARR